MKAYRPLTKHRQRGAFSVLAAASILLALGCLVLVVDTGRLYFEQRNLQKVADMAALESVSRLNKGVCYLEAADAQIYAEDNAKRNKFLTEPDKQNIQTQCATVDSPDGIRVVTPNNLGSAVKVTATHTVPTSLIIQAGSLLSSQLQSTTTLSASATAQRQEPSASFSVGAELLRLDNDRLLGLLLKAVGLNVETLTVLNSTGLADSTITPSGLLRLLGVKVGIDELRLLSPEGLLNLSDTQVGLIGIDRLVDVSLKVITDKTLRAELEALRLQILNNDILRSVKLDLFRIPGHTNTDGSPSRGLISLHTGKDGTLGSALDANINLGPLLKTSLLIGSAGRGVHIPELNILGLAKVELGIIEPPSIAAGPVGTTAYNAQVRVYVHVDSSALLGGSLRWLTETILGTRVNLPITIDVTTGYGTLDKISCSAAQPTVDISVQSKVLNTCIGKMPEEHKWSGRQSCEHYVEGDELIKLLHIPTLSGSTYIEALTHVDREAVFNKPVGGPYSTGPNPLQLGESVDNITIGLLNLLSGIFSPPDPIGFNISHLNYQEISDEKRAALLAKQYLDLTHKDGFYNVANVTDLVVAGGSYQVENNETVYIPPLHPLEPDWSLSKSVPTSCALFICPPHRWKDGTFSESFKAYTSVPYSLLDGVGISTLGNGYKSCAGLLSSLFNWNGCVQHNLGRLFHTKPGGSPVSIEQHDILSLANPNSDSVTCAGALCVMLKPILNILKPILNGVGKLLKLILTDGLGLELGRTDVEVHEINCGTARLVN